MQKSPKEAKMSDNRTINDDINDDVLEGVIKNPNRQKQPTITAQEPNYVRLGKEPIMMGKRIVPTVKKAPLPQAEAQPQEAVLMIDGEIIDEEGSSTPVEQGHFIDNNDIMFPLNNPFDRASRRSPNVVQGQVPQGTSSAPILGQPRVGEYILMVLGKIVDTGSLSQIESTVRAILYGENEQYIGQDVKEEDIVVLKRVNVQVGIFVDRE
jgi:hypothetical protein